MTALPADSHVHSEFSWDTGGPASAARGTMEATCARAVRIGLPALFFTEHLDLEDAWFSDPQDFGDHERHLLESDGRVAVPCFDAEGYFESIDRCRAAFPQLHIGTGLEVGQPHLRLAAAATALDLTRFDRILGSLHTLEVETGHETRTGIGTGTGAESGTAAGTDAGGPLPLHARSEPDTLYRRLPADEVVRRYLAEVPALVAGDEPFEIVTHLDYAVRYWPEEEAGPFDPRRFEGEFRAAMRAVAGSGRALEMNTRRLWPWIPQWWGEEGGRTLSLGSDAHTPGALAHGFPEAAAMLESFGFGPGADPQDLWRR